MRALRAAIKRTSHSSWLLTDLLLLRYVVQSERFAGRLRASLRGGDGTELLTTLARDRRSDTVFILGSGDSVNAYTPEMWSHVRSHYSIGITNWILHPFVPDVLVFESDRIAANTTLYFDNLERRRNEYSSRILCWKDPARAILTDSARLFPSWPGRVFVPRMVELPENYEYILANHDRTVGALRALLRPLGVDFIIQKRATVSYAVDLALQAGFKRIVLCGVDLRSTKYFWEAGVTAPSIAEHVTLPPTEQEGRQIHSTIDPAVNRVTIDQVLYAFNQHLAVAHGASLSVARDTSALYPRLPTYPWESASHGRI